jgi:DNA-binding winged helix-turn-helix (wHTH) protein/TolB-like protein
VSSTVTFGDFEFDAASGELRRGGENVRLEPQPARVLAVLLEHAGEVVTRVELQQRVWGSETFVDFEHGLNYCIAQVRTALGDSASEPRFIETLPRRGYRFIASAGDVSPASGSPARAAGAPAQWRRPAWAAVVAATLAVAAIWALVARRYPAPREMPVRVAVVPFDNETGLAAYDRLAQTLTDATVARLAANPDRVAVIGNAAVLREPRQRRDLIAIGAKLDVGHVILGQVQQVDGQLRITTHLIRVKDQAHLWAERFETGPADASPLDRRISDAVAGAVATRLLQPPAASPGRP